MVAFYVCLEMKPGSPMNNADVRLLANCKHYQQVIFRNVSFSDLVRPNSKADLFGAMVLANYLQKTRRKRQQSSH